MEVTRSTFSRVIVLFVGLGYQIVLRSVKKYHVNVGIVGFLYAVSLTINLIFERLRHEHEMLYVVTILVSLPLAIFNTIIFFWILMAFRRTLLYLRQKK